MRTKAMIVQLALLTLTWTMPPGSGEASTDNMHLVGGIRFRNGSDLDFRGSLAFVGSFDEAGHGGLRVVDISDPSHPVQISHFPCWGYQDDVGVWGDYVVMGMHDSGNAPGCSPDGKGGIRIIDVSDPARPTQVSFLEIGGGLNFLPTPDDGLFVGYLGGTHTLTVVGETGYVYSSPGGDAGRSTQPLTSRPPRNPITIVDIRDPVHPKIAGTFQPPGSSGCHDVTVRGNRAYCAASQESQIWDITDPLHPSVVSRISDPLIHFHHGAAPSSDGKTLVIADEETFLQLCVLDGRSPVGAFWFFDISDEAHPVRRGFLGPVGIQKVQLGAAGTRKWCSAHNFNMVPGRNWMVAASYIAGTSVIDFSNPSKPTLLGSIRPTGAATWSSYYHDGAIYTTDIARGFDVITMDGLP